MKFKYFTLHLYLLLQTLHCVMCWRSFAFRFSNVKCMQKSKLTTHLNCSIVKLRRSQEGLCLSMRFAEMIREPYLDLIILNMRPREPEFVLFNATRIIGCQFLENTGSYRILQILRREFEKYSTLPKHCPVAKDTEIHVRNLTLDPDNFPPYVPEVFFSVRAQLWERETPIWEMIVNGSVENKKRLG